MSDLMQIILLRKWITNTTSRSKFWFVHFMHVDSILKVLCTPVICFMCCRVHKMHYNYVLLFNQFRVIGKACVGLSSMS